MPIPSLEKKIATFVSGRAGECVSESDGLKEWVWRHEWPNPPDSLKNNLVMTRMNLETTLGLTTDFADDTDNEGVASHRPRPNRREDLDCGGKSDCSQGEPSKMLFHFPTPLFLRVMMLACSTASTFRKALSRPTCRRTPRRCRALGSLSPHPRHPRHPRFQWLDSELLSVTSRSHSTPKQKPQPGRRDYKLNSHENTNPTSPKIVRQRHGAAASLHLRGQL
jgi:hypothetical protein